MWNNPQEGGGSAWLTSKLLDNGILIATLRGELDNHEANQIRSHISTSIFTGQVRAIIWDLEGLGFMDSAGIGLILGRMRDLVPVEWGDTYLESYPRRWKRYLTFPVLDQI